MVCGSRLHGVKVDNWGRIAASVEEAVSLPDVQPENFRWRRAVRRFGGGGVAEGRRCCAGYSTGWLNKHL